MRESPLRLALLDYLAYRTGCEYLSGLHELDSVRRAAAACGHAAQSRGCPSG